MNNEFIKNVVEAALMVAEKPLSIEHIVALFDPVEQEDLTEPVTAAVLQLQEDYSQRGVELKKVASGYRFQSRAEFAPWVNRLWEERPARYSRALMETLAIIAYRQPITRGEIEDIRGVAVSTQIIKTLMEREWLRVAGHRDVPGRPAVYVTTQQFLDYFNLTAVADLPVLSAPGDVEKMAAEFDNSDELMELPAVSVTSVALPEASVEAVSLEVEPVSMANEAEALGSTDPEEPEATGFDRPQHEVGEFPPDSDAQPMAAIGTNEFEPSSRDELAEPGMQSDETGTMTVDGSSAELMQAVGSETESSTLFDYPVTELSIGAPPQEALTELTPDEASPFTVPLATGQNSVDQPDAVGATFAEREAHDSDSAVSSEKEESTAPAVSLPEIEVVDTSPGPDDGEAGQRPIELVQNDEPPEISVADLRGLSKEDVSAKLALVEAAVERIEEEDQDNVSPKAVRSH